MKPISQKLIVLSLGLLVSLVVGELALFLFWKEPVEEITPQFKYNYLDIYTEAFQKRGKGSRTRYRAVRPLMEEQFFPVLKGNKTKRIFIIGESTAQQYPVGLLHEGLKKTLPQFDFEIINCGMGAYDAYRTRLIGEEIVHYDPDLIIVIVGNSEFHSTRRVNRFRYQGFLSRFHLFKLLTDQINPPLKIDNLQEANNYYRANILKLFDTIKKQDIPAVLCTLPVNYRYYNCTKAVPLKYLVFNMMYLYFKDYALSEQMTSLLKEQKGLESYVYYQVGRLSDERKQHKKAFEYYSRQLNAFEFPITCPPLRNDLIRQLAREHNILLADVQKRFSELVPDGLPSFDLFQDNNHVWPSGYQIYTEEIIDAIIGSNRSMGTDILASADFWRYEELTPTGYDRIMQKIRKDKEGSAYRLLMLLVFSVATHNGPLSMEGIDLVKQIDSIDSSYFSTLSTVKKSVINETKSQIWVGELHAQPDSDQFWSKLHSHVGVGLMTIGKIESAKLHFNTAVELDGNSFTPFLFRGINRYLAGKKDEALDDFKTAVKKNSSFDWGKKLADYLDTKM